MADAGEKGAPQDPLALRAVERFGGREAVGSVLWLEHAESITFEDEAGVAHVLTPGNLAEDGAKLAGHPETNLNTYHNQDAAIVRKEIWLRGVMLPTLPVKISGDRTLPLLKLDAELKVFTVPRELARYPGTIHEFQAVEGGELRSRSDDTSLALSLRFVPTQGRVESVAIYPGSIDRDYGITAVEFGVEAVRVGIGYQKFFEVYREPQTDELPPLLAPHQF
ncbi:MAG TPA: hypothetical protein VIJ68_01555 [Candidatus Saccharimonadales bacterium]